MRDASGAEERVEGIEADFARVDIGPSREVGLAAEMDEAALSYPVGAGARLELSGLRGEVEVVARTESWCGRSASACPGPKEAGGWRWT